MRLTKQSLENLHVAERVGFDETNAGVLVFVERDGNRSYLHTAAGPACYPSITDARALIRKRRPDLAGREARATASPGR
jgi:hypothetical protein